MRRDDAGQNKNMACANAPEVQKARRVDRKRSRLRLKRRREVAGRCGTVRTDLTSIPATSAGSACVNCWTYWQVATEIPPQNFPEPNNVHCATVLSTKTNSRTVRRVRATAFGRADIVYVEVLLA